MRFLHNDRKIIIHTSPHIILSLHFVGFVHHYFLSQEKLSGFKNNLISKKNITGRLHAFVKISSAAH